MQGGILISVILPTYNRDSLLKRAIKSVLRQTFGDFELIIVDDASNDNTPQVVQNLEDPRIKYHRHEFNKGGSAARNTGIKLSKGEYIAFLDDDDEWYPNKLELQYKEMKMSPATVGLIYSGAEIVDSVSNKTTAKLYPRHKGDLSKRLLLGPTVCGSHTVFIKKECFERKGLFDEKLSSCQDWDMWKRISETYTFDYVSSILSRTNIHQDQLSKDFSALIPGREMMIKKHYDELKKHPKIIVVHLKRLGKLHCLNGTWKSAWNWFKEVLKINCFEIFKIGGWLLIEFPKDIKVTRAARFRTFRSGI
jgi:glycosyltransferase involved in cell wall biosynthesis